MIGIVYKTGPPDSCCTGVSNELCTHCVLGTCQNWFSVKRSCFCMYGVGSVVSLCFACSLVDDCIGLTGAEVRLFCLKLFEHSFSSVSLCCSCGVHVA